MAVTAARPVPQGLALTTRQREAIHGGWDQPRAATMRRFFADYPQCRDMATIRERFVWRWYCAFQYLGDKAASAVALQGGLSALAGTDLPAHLAFQRSATRYHDALRAFYYPFLFKKVAFTPADYPREPRHTFTSPPDLGTARRGLGQQLLSAGAVLALGAGWLRARSASPL